MEVPDILHQAPRILLSINSGSFTPNSSYWNGIDAVRIDTEYLTVKALSRRFVMSKVEKKFQWELKTYDYYDYILMSCSIIIIYEFVG